MIWFPTYQKMHAAIDELVAECRQIDERLKTHEEQHQTFGAMLDSSGDFGRDLIEMRDLYFVVNGGLIETSLGMQFGKVTPRQANKVIKPASKRIAELKAILDQMEAGAAMGKAAFEQRFGVQRELNNAADAVSADISAPHKKPLRSHTELKAEIPRLQANEVDERLSAETRQRASRLIKMLGGDSKLVPQRNAQEGEN